MICKVITTNFEFIPLNFQFSTMADLLDIAKLKDLLDADLPITDIASALGVSRQTIYNKMKTHSLQRLQYAEISDDDLVQVRNSII